MQFRLEPLLEQTRLRELQLALGESEAVWRSGEDTAGWHARGVKTNQQLDPSCALQGRLSSVVSEALLGNALFQAAALPERLHGVLFSRSRAGQGYGRHVDNAYMTGGRSDLSFTLFLSEPAAYDGGELVLEHPAGEESFRLPAGHALVYPSSLLHRVEPVKQGERLVAVGWVQSRIRSADQRELLFELDTVRRSLFQSEGKGERFDLLCRCYSNLLRQWGE